MREYAQRTLNPDDLFALQYVHDARLSSDGRRIAYVKSQWIEAAGSLRDRLRGSGHQADA
jgi:hypothetical protein